MARSKARQRQRGKWPGIILGIAGVSIFACSPCAAYVRSTFSNGTALFWPNASTTVNLQFGCPQGSSLTIWGPCWDDAAADALNHWNTSVPRFRFIRQSSAVATDPCTHSDLINTAAFAATICGKGFGDALAVTIIQGNDDGSLVDADVLVNSGATWSTYAGALQRNSAGAVTNFDFHRVVMHEFGHVLGLDHPDEHGQDVTALMNSHVSDIDDVQPDDSAGANAIYPAATISDALLEDPQPGAVMSGVTVIRGWVCAAARVDLQIDGASFQAAYPTARGDTQSVCGDVNNGFSFLWNWNHLGSGVHTVVALRDGVEFGRATVTVVTLGQEFLTGVSAQYRLSNFPSAGQNVIVEWRESLQNFVIVGVE
jgi:Matrixin